MTTDYENNEEIKIFREYLRIPSVHPNIDYEPCLKFIKAQADSLDLSYNVYRVVNPKKPVVILTWKGSDSKLPAILLNSHMDVVPVFEEYWTHPPFAAEMDKDGKIFARGSQDMKCCGTQYLGAIRALKKAGFVPKRTIHVSFVPEEEIGGVEGMQEFVLTDEFKALNVGFALDEAIASEDEVFHLFYAERSIWHVQFRINGTPGHGLVLLPETAGEKATRLMSKIMAFRETQVKKMKEENLLIGQVTTVNLTKMSGGVQTNVVPPQLTVTFDMRLALDVDHAQFEAQLKQWCEESGGGIEIFFEIKNPYVPPTKMEDSDPYWKTFKGTLDELGLKIRPSILPGATDNRFLRRVGITAFGFMPINNHPLLLHDHDEFLKAETYLKGIEYYTKIIENLSSLA
ncbi:aminoacylase-1-like [Culicoides brevitarsis]|uniref:aminoacylase-1-like n=1 Tax=Culicoides brevitarsis TaxID=469753 RepID=UPI00307BDC2A